MSLFSDLLNINTNSDQESSEVIPKIGGLITKNGYKVVDEALDKPWGAFWRFNNAQAEKFINEFFPGFTIEEAERGVAGAELSPKILLVAPHQRLSWQYHHRRAERWRNIAGPAGYHRSINDDQGEKINFLVNDIVQFDTGERHRLVSDGGWSIVAEIWQHSDPTNPTNEEDIVRVADDYNR